MTEENTKQVEFITIELEGQELRFEKEPATRGYDSFINTAGSGKLAKAANNYCVAAVTKDDLVAFRELKQQNPGAAIQIASELADTIAPDLGATVKKR